MAQRSAREEALEGARLPGEVSRNEQGVCGSMKNTRPVGGDTPSFPGPGGGG